MKSLLYCRDPGKAGQNFIPAKRDHVITPLEVYTRFSQRSITENIATIVNGWVYISWVYISTLIAALKLTYCLMVYTYEIIYLVRTPRN